MKETTGHSSDAVDAYQITSDQQKEQISKILSAKPNIDPLQSVTGTATEPTVPPMVSNVSASNTEIGQKPSCKVVNVDEEKSKCSCASDNVGSMIDKIISDVSSSGKTRVKIQIEIVKE